jgi:O-antigen/teichoic acid export membrane protein
MTRTRRALTTSMFVYLQYAAAIVISIVLVPLVLSTVDVRAYGLWLTASDLLGYIGLLDLGVFGVLPWLVAEADGRRDEATIRRGLSNAVAASLLIGAACALAAFGAWSVFPGLLKLTAADRAALAGPLLILVAATAITMPMNVCGAALIGMQDVRFGGFAALTRLALNASLTITLLLRGWDLYAVAVGTAVPAIVVGVFSVIRLRVRYAPLTRHWPRPSLDGVRWLARTSIGAWFGAFGWKLLSMSNGLVLTATGHPELVPLYSCTARLGLMLVQMAWIVPDSGLVGLAQLHGEGRRARLQEITRAMLRLHLILAGIAMTAVLAVNPAFVSWWVSEAMFGGHRLNVLLAAGIATGSIAHAMGTVSSVLGRRLEVGIATVANGIVQVLSAYALTFVMGFQGLALAALLAACVTLLPVGLKVAAWQTGTSARLLLWTIAQWLLRALPLCAAAFAVGFIVPVGAVWLAGALWLPIGLAYVWTMRPLYAELPIDPRFRTLLATLRLVPASDPTTVGVPEPVV